MKENADTMESKKSHLSKVLLLLAIFLVLGCNLPTSILPTATPLVEEVTPEFAGTIAAAQTQAVEIAMRDLTLAVEPNAFATVTLRATSTSSVSSTPVASFTPPPTITPPPPATYTPVQPPAPVIVVTAVPTKTPTKSPYQCKISSVSPNYGTKMTKGVDFDLRVTLENTGTETWSSGDMDFAYISGARFQQHLDALDMNADVDPGDDVSFVVDMAANTGLGNQSARWRLGDFCTVYFNVYVVE